MEEQHSRTSCRFVRTVKRNAVYKLIALAISIGLGIFVYCHYYRADQTVVPQQYQGPITEQEIYNQTLKWKSASGATNVVTESSPPPTTDAVDRTHPVRLAIGGLGLADDSQNGELADLVLSDLNGVKGFELVDRQSIEHVLQEQDLSLSELVRAKDAIRVGKLLGTDWFLFATTAVAQGTNAAVARLVDARTGVLLNVGVLSHNGGKLQLARSLADFVQESRDNINHPTQRIYLALGALEDLSLNNRQADFPNQLRGYLMAACRNTNVTLLEREYVEALLQEMRLDLAGLTADSDTKSRPMQSAYWLVSGAYQSYENNGFEVEAVLDINQIMGRRQAKVTFRGKPNDALFAQIYQAIIEKINQNTNFFVPTRRTEAMNQLMIGKDLLQAGRSMPGNDYHLGLAFTENTDTQLSGAEKVRRRHNLQEAIKAFQAVLILDPTNRDAKLCLADCLQNPTIGRIDESREMYREVLEESMEDQWVNAAEFGLWRSFENEGPWSIGPWYASAAARTASPKAKEYFQQKADSERTYAKHFEGPPAAVSVDAATLQLAKSNLLKSLEDPHYGGSGNIWDFANTFGTNKSSAADALMAFLPEMEAKFPEKKQTLIAAVLSMQVNTNNPLFAEFEQILNEAVAHPDQLSNPDDFWFEMRESMVPWCINHRCLRLAETIVDFVQRDHVTNAYYADDGKIIMGLEYYSHGQWEDALRIFQRYSNHPIIVQSTFRTDDWVSLFQGPVLPGWYVADCERRLGRQPVRDPRQFLMENPLFELDRNSVFETDGAGLWIAGHGQLRHLNFHLDTDFQVSLPIADGTPIKCLWLDSSSIWLGTAGEGLLQVRKADHQSRRFTLQDGLLMNAITQLASDDQSLWIGYGDGDSGGLGRLGFASQQFTSFMPSLNTNRSQTGLVADPLDGPPRHSVMNVAIQSTGEVLTLVTNKGLQRYCAASNSWETLPSQFTISSVAANDVYLVQGIDIVQFEVEVRLPINPSTKTKQAERIVFAVPQDHLAATMSAYATNQFGQRNEVSPGRGRLLDLGGLEVCTLANGTWRTLRDVDGIPGPPKTLLLRGNDLWVAGEAFLACVDLNDLEVKKYCYVPALVRSVQTGGGYVWAQFNGHLYRSPVSTPSGN